MEEEKERERESKFFLNVAREKQKDISIYSDTIMYMHVAETETLTFKLN